MSFTLLFLFNWHGKNPNLFHICLYIYLYKIASTPIIEIIEDTSEPVDECDMTYLMDVLAQYNPQGLSVRMLNIE
jgi:hypothetical protein